MSSQDQKFRFLRKVYFGVSDNPEDDVNPYNDLEEFGSAIVGSLNWGIGNDTRERSKIRFAQNYHLVLEKFKVDLSTADIFMSIRDDEQVNNDIVSRWLDLSKFN